MSNSDSNTVSPLVTNALTGASLTRRAGTHSIVPVVLLAAPASCCGPYAIRP